jgi:hypothetical protein
MSPPVFDGLYATKRLFPRLRAGRERPAGRHGRVILILNLADDYAAIEAYEKLIVQAREGFVLLDVETAGASDA